MGLTTSRLLCRKERWAGITAGFTVPASSEGRWELQCSVGSSSVVCLWGRQWAWGGVCSFVVVVWFSLLLGCFLFSVFVNFKLGNILNKYYLIKNEFWNSVLV